jgi:hypothetical protein
LFGRDGGSSCAGTPFTTVALSTEQTVITSLITTETVVQVPTTVTIPHSVCISAACCSHYAMIFTINIVLGGYFSAVLGNLLPRWYMTVEGSSFSLLLAGQTQLYPFLIFPIWLLFLWF